MSLPQPQQLIASMAQQLQTQLDASELEQAIVVGIHTGGAWIADNLHQALKLGTPLGSLDISFYRDDFTRKGLHPEVKSSNLPSIEDKTVILVDDVIMSGRTIRAAMNELFDYGRPNKVVLAALLDVGQRELPIQPDICGTKVNLEDGQRIKIAGPSPLTCNIVTLEEGANL